MIIEICDLLKSGDILARLQKTIKNVGLATREKLPHLSINPVILFLNEAVELGLSRLFALTL